MWHVSTSETINRISIKFGIRLSILVKKRSLTIVWNQIRFKCYRILIKMFNMDTDELTVRVYHLHCTSDTKEQC
jgi:hypothetical protein